MPLNHSCVGTVDDNSALNAAHHSGARQCGETLAGMLATGASGHTIAGNLTAGASGKTMAGMTATGASGQTIAGMTGAGATTTWMPLNHSCVGTANDNSALNAAHDSGASQSGETMAAMLATGASGHTIAGMLAAGASTHQNM